MGKKGKRSGRGKQETARTPRGLSCGGAATRSRSDGGCKPGGSEADETLPWEMLTPIPGPSTSIDDLASKFIERIDPTKQRRRAEIEAKGATWRVWARRARMWLGEQDQQNGARPGKRKSHRSWWIGVVICFPTDTVSCSVLVEDLDVVSQTTDSICLRHALTADMVLAAIQKVLDEKGIRPPSEIVFWPSLDGAFRVESVDRIVEDLRERIGAGKTTSVRALESVTAISSEGTPGGAASSFSPSLSPAEEDANDPGGMFAQNDHGILRSMEEHIQRAERNVNKAENGYNRSSKVKCLSETLPQLSTTEMKLAFSAARMFHDVRPWELISNFHPVVVKVPILEISKEGQIVPSMAEEGCASLRTFVAVVAGNGCWDSRGVYLYDSWDDMMEWVSRSQRRIPQIVLQYFDRTWTPFRTLDCIEELGLDISNSGDGGKKNKYVAEDAYPCIHVSDRPVSMSAASNQDEIHSTPPTLRDLNCASLAMMAIAEFASNPDYVKYATSPCGKPGVSFAEVPVNVSLELSKGVFYASTVQMCSMDNPSQYALSAEEEMATLSIGARKECNYCQKPQSVNKRDGGVKLKECSRCHTVRYCSERCQFSHWPRHKKECRKR